MDPNFAFIRSTLQKHNLAIPVSVYLKLCLEAIIILDPQISDEECIFLVQEDFHVEVM